MYLVSACNSSLGVVANYYFKWICNLHRLQSSLKYLHLCVRTWTWLHGLVHHVACSWKSVANSEGGGGRGGMGVGRRWRGGRKVRENWKLFCSYTTNHVHKLYIHPLGTCNNGPAMQCQCFFTWDFNLWMMTSYTAGGWWPSVWVRIFATSAICTQSL